MKKQTYTFVGLLLLFTFSSAVAIRAQSEGTVRVQIPFEFSSRNQTIKAGRYEVKRQEGNGEVWVLRGLDNQRQMVLAASYVKAKSNFSNGKMTFRKYGDTYFLATIETPAYQITMPKTRSEKLLVKTLRTNNLAKNNKDNIVPDIVAVITN